MGELVVKLLFLNLVFFLSKEVATVARFAQMSFFSIISPYLSIKHPVFGPIYFLFYLVKSILVDHNSFNFGVQCNY